MAQTQAQAHLKYIDAVCKIGQGNACCRYLAVGPSGFCCMKETNHKSYLDRRAAMKMMTAQADNCPGHDPELDLNTLDLPITIPTT